MSNSLTTTHTTNLQSAMAAVDSQESFTQLLTSYYDGEFYGATVDGDDFLDWQEAQSEVYFPSFDEWEQFCLDLGIA
jgi:hypothetical protein